MSAGSAAQTVETQRLVLRRWCSGDAAALAAINADPEVMRYIGDGRPLSRRSSDDLLWWFEHEWDTRGFGLWAVEEDGGLVGFCGLTVPMFLPEVLPAVEIGWRLGRDAWGRGLATEAARAALRLGFDELRMAEIIAIVNPANARSLRVGAKLGMTARPSRLHPVSRTRLTVLGARPSRLH